MGWVEGWRNQISGLRSRPWPPRLITGALAAAAMLALAGCGSSKTDAGGFTKSDRLDAQRALDTLEYTSIPSAVLQISDESHVPNSCTVHLQSKSPTTFRVFLTWIPRNTDIANGDSYTWLEAIVSPTGEKPVFHMGNIPSDVPHDVAMRQLESHYGTAMQLPYEKCEVLANGDLYELSS